MKLVYHITSQKYHNQDSNNEHRIDAEVSQSLKVIKIKEQRKDGNGIWQLSSHEFLVIPWHVLFVDTLLLARQSLFAIQSTRGVWAGANTVFGVLTVICNVLNIPWLPRNWGMYSFHSNCLLKVMSVLHVLLSLWTVHSVMSQCLCLQWWVLQCGFHVESLQQRASHMNWALQGIDWVQQTSQSPLLRDWSWVML